MADSRVFKVTSKLYSRNTSANKNSQEADSLRTKEAFLPERKIGKQ